jgi:hypothetical protein
MHAIRSFRLSRASAARNLATLHSNGGSMNIPRHSHSLDDVLFVIMLFAPVSLLLSGALALGAFG